MKLINLNTLKMLASKNASYIALGTVSKQVAWQMMTKAGFVFVDGSIRTEGATYESVATRSGEIAFKRV